jgi:hypothetical protein
MHVSVVNVAAQNMEFVFSIEIIDGCSAAPKLESFHFGRPAADSRRDCREGPAYGKRVIFGKFHPQRPEFTGLGDITQYRMMAEFTFDTFSIHDAHIATIAGTI